MSMSSLYKEIGKNPFLVKSEGFTLLEVLIAVVISAISLLAIASGEVTALNTGRGSSELSVAASSGQEILERIQRNRTNVLSYNGFDTNNSATRPSIGGMAQTDYDRWKAGIQTVAGGRGQITVASGTPIATTSKVTVTITIPSRTLIYQAVLQ
jgi:prepilin-type N-terminal cleavage/methylation domain-containing protein